MIGNFCNRSVKLYHALAINNTMRHDVCTKLIWITYVIHNLAVGCGVRKYTMLAQLAHSIKCGMTSSGFGNCQTADGCCFAKAIGQEGKIVGCQTSEIFSGDSNTSLCRWICDFRLFDTCAVLFFV